MELTASRSSRCAGAAAPLAARIDPPAIAAWTLAFALVAYLALSNGGYDTIVRSAGRHRGLVDRAARRAGRRPADALRRARAGSRSACSRRSPLWTGLATAGRRAPSAASIELGRVATYLGVLVLAIALQGRDGGAPHDQRARLRDRARDAAGGAVAPAPAVVPGQRPLAFLGAGQRAQAQLPAELLERAGGVRGDGRAAAARRRARRAHAGRAGARRGDAAAVGAVRLPDDLARRRAGARRRGRRVPAVRAARAWTRWERCSSPASGRRSCCRRRRSATRCRTACRRRRRSTRARSSSGWP